MKPGMGKQKGAQFERDVCVMLSKWLTDGKQEDVFWRSALSGGRATVGFKKGKNHANQVGDISCIHPIGNHFISDFAPECKFYAKLDYEGLFTGKGKLLSFWKEINEQAVRYGKKPFMVVKQNRMPIHICLSFFGVAGLKLRHMNALVSCPKQDIYFFEADTFFQVCKPYVADLR